MSTGNETRDEIAHLPWFLRIALDAVMLRSTPMTAVFWGSFLLVALIHMAWACGFLAHYGMDAGFMRVSEQTTADQKLEQHITAVEQTASQRIERVEKKIDWQLKLTITRELRDAVATYCKVKDPAEAKLALNYVDELVEQYRLVTGQSPPVTTCKG